MKNTNYINDYDFVKQLIEKGNVKRVFDVVNNRMRGDMLRPHILKVEYSDCAFLIFNLVSKFGDGFVVDICDRVLESIHACREIQISDKQRWCVAFALLKVTTEEVDAYVKEVSAMLREDPEIAEEKNEDEQEGDASTIFENESDDALQKNIVTLYHGSATPIEEVKSDRPMYFTKNVEVAKEYALGLEDDGYFNEESYIYQIKVDASKAVIEDDPRYFEEAAYIDSPYIRELTYCPKLDTYLLKHPSKVVLVESYINSERYNMSYEKVPSIYCRPKQAIGSIAVYR